jgi:hypothetical protein
VSKLYNLARMTTATAGAGTITLGAALSGFLSFGAAGVQDGDVVTYAISDGANSEIGRGTYTAAGTTLTRNVLRSTNSNSAISLSGSAQVFITAAAEDFAAPTPPQGRLTLTSGTAVPTADVASATTLFYTPAIGRFVPLWNGNSLVMTDTGGELLQATTDTSKSPAAIAANSNYDIFVWSDGGTMRATRGPAWTSDTGRGTGVGTTELDFTTAPGVPLNKNAVTNGPLAGRGTYVGTVRSDGNSFLNMTFGTAAAGGGQAILGVWNAYNPELVYAKASDSTANWTQTSSTQGPLNASTGNRINLVSGLAIHAIDVYLSVHLNSAAVSGAKASIGFGLDTTTAADFTDQDTTQAALSVRHMQKCRGGYKPQLGFHFIQALQAGDGTNAAVWDQAALNGPGLMAWLQM